VAARLAPPTVLARLAAAHAEETAAFATLAACAFFFGVPAVPLLFGALAVLVSSASKNENENANLTSASFASKKGPLATLYLAGWCVAAYATAAAPADTTPRFARAFLGTAGGSDSWNVFVLFSALVLAAGLTRVARTTPAESELERTFGRTRNGAGVGFYRLDVAARKARGTRRERDPEVFPETLAAFAESDDERDRRGRRVLDVVDDKASVATDPDPARDRSTHSENVSDSNALFFRGTLTPFFSVAAPLALWLVGFSAADAMHFLLVLAFAASLGDSRGAVFATRRFAFAKRVVAASFFVSYVFALETSVAAISLLGSKDMERLLVGLGAWHPGSPSRGVAALAAAAAVTCFAGRARALEEVLGRVRAALAKKSEGDASDAASDDSFSPTSSRRRSGWESAWALASALGEEFRLSAAAVLDGRGAYVVLSVAIVSTATGAPSLLHLLTLALAAGATLAPDADDDASCSSSSSGGNKKTRWRFVFYFATANLLLRYACASFPVFAALGLSKPPRRF
jgi:hypothetical protein